MNRPIAEDGFSDKLADAPLDPAVERVRRKLIRFAIVNLGILFVALAAVVAALAWRTVSSSDARNSGPVEALLQIPDGARIASQSLSPDAISLLAAWGDGSQSVLVYDRSDGRLVGHYRIAAQRNAP